MNIFTELEDDIEGWFSKQERSAKKLFGRIEPLVAEAEPIVAGISTAIGVTAGVEKSVIMTKIAGYLGTVTTDAAKVEGFVTDNQGAPLNSILHYAAVFALTLGMGSTATTVISDVDLAVQTAYSVLKEAKL